MNSKKVIIFLSLILFLLALISCAVDSFDYERFSDNMPVPDIHIAGGNMVDFFYISINLNNENAIGYYTTDGSTPTKSSKSFVSHTEFDARPNDIIKVISTQKGRNDSPVYTYVVEDNRTGEKLKNIQIFSEELKEGGYRVFFYSEDDFVQIFYTTDGTRPTIKSNSLGYYTSQGMIFAEENTTIKAFSVKDNCPDSDIVEYKVTRSDTVTPIEMPTIREESTGEHSTRFNIYFSHPINAVQYYYTIDGSIPTTESTLYTPYSLTVDKGTVIKVFSYLFKNVYSEVVTYTVGDKSSIEPMDAPELTAERENAQGTIFNVKFSHSEPGTTIYYTTDGSDPTLESDSVLNNWNSTRQIEEGTIVRAFAYQENMASSEVTSFKVVDEKSPSSVQPPVINFKKENQYSADYEVLFSSPEISSETQSSVIYYYTLDGSTPNTNSKSTVCANAIVVQKGTTVKVIAKYAGFPISECSTATINDDSIQEKLEIPGIKLIRINTDSIEFNVSFNHQAITSQILDDITFYYTMDGSNPTLNSSSIRYSDNILITAEDGTVIKVFAGSDGLIYSEIASYTVSDEKSPSTIKPPTINFNRLNKYSSSFEVDFSSPEINSSAQKYVKYYYTTDGTNPSLISSSVNYNTPIIVSEGTIINVIAQYANFSPSDYSIKNIKTESQPEKIDPPILRYEKIADWAWEYNITVTHPAIIKGILDDLTFFYTTDGSIPTVNSKSFNYSDNKTLSMIEMNTIKVFACYEGTNKSDIISFKVGISSGPQVEPNPY